MTFGIIDKTLEGRQRVYFPHFTAGKVPTDFERNDRFRKTAFAITKSSERRMLKRMCAEDFLFYCYGFAYLFNAADEDEDGQQEPGPVPFLLYPFQVELATALWRCLHEPGKRSPARVKKPRRLGLTWLMVALFEHCWHFFKNRHLLVGSYREEEVDGTIRMARKAGDAGEWSKLMPKFDFLHLHQPSWLLPEGYVPLADPFRTTMKIMNPAMGSIIWGTSAAGVSGRQTRGWASFWDEAAHTPDLFDIIGSLSKFAKSKFWVSSIGDLDHPFSTILKDAAGVVQLSPEWWMHPDYAKGLRIDEQSGERTSPWLARQLDEIAHNPIIANREIYADESRQVGGYYDPNTFHLMLGTRDKPGTVMEPLAVGSLDIIDHMKGPEAIRFVEQSGGLWKLWHRFGSDGKPPRNTAYAIGADIAAGTQDTSGRGASCSVLAVADRVTGELVAQYVTHGVRPEVLARVAFAAAWWFQDRMGRPARINFEKNGDGASFGVALRAYGFDHFWHAPDKTEPGFAKQGEGGRLAFALHQQMLCEGRFIERDADCVAEMRHYKHPSSGKGPPVHSASLHSEDPSGARENHGDRTCARIVLCLMLNEAYNLPEGEREYAFGSYDHVLALESRQKVEAELV